MFEVVIYRLRMRTQTSQTLSMRAAIKPMMGQFGSKPNETHTLVAVAIIGCARLL